MQKFKIISCIILALFTLIIDGCGGGGDDASVTTATTQNTSPVANAGADQALPVGATVHLDGSGSSDADGDTLNYHWTLTLPVASTAVLTNETSANPTFTIDIGGTYVATLLVNDGATDSASDTVKINSPTDGTVLSAGKIWMDRNLGASQVATSSTDSAATGDLYQWGRGTDGHEKLSSSTTTTNSTSDVPGHGDFITEDSIIGDWRVPPNNSLWQGISGINNPCPEGFRIPTDTEWETEVSSWTTIDSAGAFRSPLKLVEAGFRFSKDGLLYPNYYGFYWSSTVSYLAGSPDNGSFARHLNFGSYNAVIASKLRANAMSVRCIQNQ